MKKVNKSKADNSDVFQVKDTCLFRVENQSRVIIMNLEDQRVYSADNLGAYLWLMLDGSLSIDKVIKAMVKDLKIKEPSFPNFVQAFVKDLFLKNLIETTKDIKASQRNYKQLKKVLLKTDKKNFKKIAVMELQNYVAAASSPCGP